MESTGVIDIVGSSPLPKACCGEVYGHDEGCEGAVARMSEQKPTVGRMVHYQAHGSPDGTHPSVPRAAIVTGVHDDETVDLCVLNPSGLFFNQRCVRSDEAKGGTWRWPPRV